MVKGVIAPIGVPIGVMAPNELPIGVLQHRKHRGLSHRQTQALGRRSVAPFANMQGQRSARVEQGVC